MHKKIVALTLLATLLIGTPGLVFAFGLGDIEINSALNQPMDAEIELVGINAATIDEVQVELANQQMFEKVGVPRPYILTRLKFTPTISNGKPVIRVTSTDSIREPFLTFLVDLRWAKGKLLREYTVLLDPPVFGEKAKAAIQAPKIATRPETSAPVAKKPVSNPSNNVASAPAPKVPTPSARPKRETIPTKVTKPAPLKKTNTRPVRNGDTVWSIAEPYAREYGVSVNQMMLAIQEANPQGFSSDNINNLKSGTVLRIPAEDLSKYSAREALAEVKRQWRAWKQGTQDGEDSAVNVDAGEMADGEMMKSPDAMEQHKPDASSSNLSILGEGDVLEGKSGDDAEATLKELRKQVSLLKESSQSKGQENAELKGRIESLESMLSKQENIIKLQNEQLAQLQNSLAVQNETSDQKNAMEAATQELASAEQQVEEMAAEMQADSEQVIKPAKVEPLPDFSEPIPEEFLKADQQAPDAEPESLVAEAEVTSETMADPEKPAMETPVSESMLDKITSVLRDQGKTLIAAGAGLLGLLLVWIGVKRRRENTENAELAANGLPAFEEEPSIDEMLDDLEAVKADEVDKENEMAAASESSAEADDILAEADVYISYGFYQQAEELLNEGLSKDPNNLLYKVKLAEIYSADKRSDDFISHLEGFASNMNKKSPEWGKIAAVGAALVPTHALFASDNASELDDDSVQKVGISEGDKSSTEVIDSGVISDFRVASEDMEDFDTDDLDDDNSLDFTFADDYEFANPSVIEEVGTKLDLAKAFVDMGDEDAAKETLTEVMEQGDQAQIQQAKELLDKLN